MGLLRQFITSVLAQIAPSRVIDLKCVPNLTAHPPHIYPITEPPACRIRSCSIGHETSPALFLRERCDRDESLNRGQISHMFVSALLLVAHFLTHTYKHSMCFPG